MRNEWSQIRKYAIIKDKVTCIRYENEGNYLYRKGVEQHDKSRHYLRFPGGWKDNIY